MMVTSYGPEFGKVSVGGLRALGQVAEITPNPQRLDTPRVT